MPLRARGRSGVEAAYIGQAGWLWLSMVDDGSGQIRGAHRLFVIWTCC